VTTPLPEPVPDTTTPELDALETETRTLIDRHLDDARDVAATTVASPVEATRRNSRLMDRLRQARAAIIDTAMGAVRRAVPLGARDAAREAPPPAGTEVRYVPDDVDVHRATGDIDLRNDVSFIISSQGLRVEINPPGRRREEALEVVEQTLARIHNVTTTGIHRAYNRGRQWYAALFAYDLKWFTRVDERTCPRCRPMHGRVIASKERFSLREPDWEGFDGLPPLHFRCRCYTEVVRRRLFGGEG